MRASSQCGEHEFFPSAGQYPWAVERFEGRLASWQPVGLPREKEMENGKQGTGDSKPVNATAQPHLPVFRFLFPAENKWINMYPAVNNYFLQPPFSQGFTACPASASSTCALSATWVADLDQLEANAPGTFIGQLLNVSFFADDNDATGSNRFVSGTLIVRMEKKK